VQGHFLFQISETSVMTVEEPEVKMEDDDISKSSPSKRPRLDEPIKTRRGPWTAEEDELLTNLVKRYGTKKWAIIAELVPGRVGKQCRERWLNHLRTDVLKTAWTDEEDAILIRAQQDLGNRWSAIARMLPGRPENSVKNRWNSLINKKKRFSIEDPESANVSSDDQSSVIESCNESSSPSQDRDTHHRLSPVGHEHDFGYSQISTKRFSTGSECNPITDAKSLSILPAMTPTGGSPVSSTFGAKGNILNNSNNLWNGFANQLGAHPQMMYRAMHPALMPENGPRLFPYVLPPSALSALQHRLPVSSAPAATPSTPSNSSAKDDSKGAAQGLLLLATLCT
jgi:hypothetical protein